MKFSAKELSRINELDMDVELQNSKIQMAEIRVANLQLKQKILAQELIDAQGSVHTQKSIASVKLEAKRDFLKRMAKKYKLVDGWGFSPDTGEIIQGGVEG